MLGRGLRQKKFCTVTLLSLVRKIFQKFLNNRLLEKCDLFDFQYDLYLIEFVSVVSYRIGRALNRFGATRAIRRDISKALNRVWDAGLLHKLKAYGILGGVFGLIYFQ